MPANENGQQTHPSHSTHPQDASAYYASGGGPNQTSSPYHGEPQPRESNVQQHSVPYSRPNQMAQYTNPPSPGDTPYRPRPSPTPSFGGGRSQFCEHGVSFDCGYGCHRNTTPISSPSLGGSSDANYSPSSSGPMSRYSSPLSNPPITPNATHGRPAQASLPYRMPPGPSVDAGPQANYGAPGSGTPSPGMNTFPRGQPGYANLPNRMAPGSYMDPASDATRTAKRRSPGS
ncbi:hypothetical protein D9756_006488 [Leucocoprinus leucothites]|uniref:Uncharacterized protein n=1 Tax=Leucocoprinus leucothites TaxID=201217 RepID=A0A8H5LH73_9AGAR|nr:hypothetical protein D9756_006488 [Leucoagaricus leucothites]